MENYLHRLPCECAMKEMRQNQYCITSIHSTLSEYLNVPQHNLRMNHLDEKRRKKILVHLESLKDWISKEIDFDESKCYETIKELNKIARALHQMAFDVKKRNSFFFYRDYLSFFNISCDLDTTFVTGYILVDDLGCKTGRLCSSSTRRSSIHFLSK